MQVSTECVVGGVPLCQRDIRNHWSGTTSFVVSRDGNYLKCSGDLITYGSSISAATKFG